MSELLILWLIFAAIVGAAASARGRSGFGWALLAVLMSPVLALILLVVLPNVADRARQLENEHRQRNHQLTMERMTAAALRSNESVRAPVPEAAHRDPVATLGVLAEARDRGLITADEFNAKKAELLARI